MAIVIDTLDVGGAERSLIEIASRFRRYEPTVVTCYRGAGLADLVERSGIPWRRLDISGRYALSSVSGALASALKDYQADVVHATLFRAEVAARTVCPALELPLLGSFVNDSYSPVRFRGLSLTGQAKLRAVQLIDGATARRSTGFTAISKAVASSNAAALRLPESLIEVIYRGRDATQYQRITAVEREAIRRQLDVDASAPLILNVARLLSRKGQHDLIAAMPGVVRRWSGARLVIAGEGPERAALESHAARLGIGRHVALVGSRSDIPRLLQACDVFAFPSHYEGLGGALVEAMLSGCAIVASDTDVHRESVVNGRSAILYPSGDVSACERALIKLSESATLRKTYGDAAQRDGVARFSIEQVASAHEDLYDRIIQCHRDGVAFRAAGRGVT